MDRQVLVTGATGYVGGRLVPRLLEKGYRVRCLVRSPEKLDDRAWRTDTNLEIVQGDLEESASLRTALSGCHLAYYLVHSMVAAGEEYAQRDLELARNFRQAAEEESVARIVYLGGLGELGNDLSLHLKSRREVEEVLADGSIPLTVLRAAMIIGSGSASFEILRYLVEHLPVMITPKWVRTKTQPIAIRNVLGYLVGCVEQEATAGKTFDIGGPDILSYQQIMDIMAEERGLSRWVVPVPVLTPKLSSLWIDFVTPVDRSIARPLAEGLRNPTVCRNDTIRTLIPQDLLTVREAIRASLVNLQDGNVETSWSMAGPMPGDPDWTGGTVFNDTRETIVEATPEQTFSTVCRLGGEHGYYNTDWLWHLRGMLDKLFGGPGLRRGRRDPDDLKFGEAVDFWRVVGLERNQSLRLRAEMKLPGIAELQFDVQPASDHRSRLTMQARFQPKGVTGIAYWYSVLPLHILVFPSLLNGIKREAEATVPSDPVGSAS